MNSTAQAGGRIPAQAGARADAGPAGSTRRDAEPVDSVRRDSGSGDAATPGSGAAEFVIPGAGTAPRPGERATVKLRENGPEESRRYAPEWLELREGADAAARAYELLD